MPPAVIASRTALTVRPAKGLRGVVRVPGDKSVSHRALILAGLATGESQITGVLRAADIDSTRTALAAFGVHIRDAGDALYVRGGVWRSPDQVIDCANAGTAARLLMGAAAGFELKARFTGDASLMRRPMHALQDILSAFGARLELTDKGTLPGILRGGHLKGASILIRDGSAQLKSAALLAAINAKGESWVTEDMPARDHTERLMRSFGIHYEAAIMADGGMAYRLEGPQALCPADIRIPGDASSAAFLVVAALITPDSDITLRDVGLNPLRAGYLSVLMSMGGDIEITPTADWGGEPVGDVRVRSSALTGVTLGPEWAPRLMDEYPALAIAAACAKGRTRFQGVAALRVKESDRIAALCQNLTRLGITVEEQADGFEIFGTGHAPEGGVRIATQQDHRIAMAFACLGGVCPQGLTVDHADMIATSYPDFVRDMCSIGAAMTTDAVRESEPAL